MLCCQQVYLRRMPHIHHTRRRTAGEYNIYKPFVSFPLVLSPCLHCHASSTSLSVSFFIFCGISFPFRTNTNTCTCAQTRHVQISSCPVQMVVALITSRGKQSATLSPWCSCCRGGPQLPLSCMQQA